MFRYFLALFLLCLPLSVSAATLTRTGAQDVNLGGTLYDLEFISGSCAEHFEGCARTSASVLDEATALLAASALLGLIDANPDIDANLGVTGCALGTDVCVHYIPYAPTFTPNVVAYLAVENWELIDDDLDSYSMLCCLRPGSTTQSRNETFARWTPSPERPQAGAIVPLPASAVMMLSAFAGLGGLRRLRRRA